MNRYPNDETLIEQMAEERQQTLWGFPIVYTDTLSLQELNPKHKSLAQRIESYQWLNSDTFTGAFMRAQEKHMTIEIGKNLADALTYLAMFAFFGCAIYFTTRGS